MTYSGSKLICNRDWSVAAGSSHCKSKSTRSPGYNIPTESKVLFASEEILNPPSTVRGIMVAEEIWRVKPARDLKLDKYGGLESDGEVDIPYINHS